MKTPSLQRAPLHSRRRQEKHQQQLQQKRRNGPSSSARNRQPTDPKKMWLCRTIFVLSFAALFYAYSIVFSNAHAETNRRSLSNPRWTLLGSSSKSSSSSSSSSSVKKKHSLRETPRQIEEPDQEPMQQRERPNLQRNRKRGKKPEGKVPLSATTTQKKQAQKESTGVAQDHIQVADESLSTSESVNHHIIFSTDCSPYQRWQSYLLFFHAHRVKQPGKITRIASGCNDEEAKEEVEWHTEHISGQISQDYGIHLTPHFTRVKDETGKDTGKDYKFFNKPFGVRHWMEHNPDMGFHADAQLNTDTKTRDDTIVILIDPDMVLLRPITRDFPLDQTHRAMGILADYEKGGRPIRVTHGQPFAQLFGFGNAWQKLDIATITGDPNSPASKVGSQIARAHYPVGPPYLATAVDMHRIVMKWSEYVPKVHAEHPFLMAEMYAFCIAAAHLELPHQVMNSLMISDVGSSAEGWNLFVNDVEEGDMCRYASERVETAVAEVVAGERKMPGVLHHCQRYLLGKWFFGKRRVPKDFFSCDQPLLMTPPDNLDTLYDYFVPPPSKGKPDGGPNKPAGQKYQIVRTTFMLCYLIEAMNEASRFYKEKSCDGNSNLNKSMELWKA